MEVFKTRNQKELKLKLRSIGLSKDMATAIAHDTFEGLQFNPETIFEITGSNGIRILIEATYKRPYFQGELNCCKNN